ncbi:uncharacterized protein BDV17DRAFT_273866, partial [Aspergillus undulatus]|uniref:uncharacterized protein n=1 Tax=Aspergillus undulatus TaxID=1810928 RepID=UPI003CCD6EEE
MLDCLSWKPFSSQRSLLILISFFAGRHRSLPAANCTPGYLFCVSLPTLYEPHGPIPSSLCGVLSMKMSKLLVPTTLFSAKYAPKQLLTAIAQRYILYSPGNPILPKIRYMCDNRDRNTLWWRVSTASLSSHKKVVRSWCARRARAAFTHEMKARGYDAEGKRIRSDTPLSQTVTESSGNMKGTLTIYLSPASL